MSVQTHPDQTAMRLEVDRLIGGGHVREANLALARLWGQQPGPALAGFVVSRLEGSGDLRLQPTKLALLRSFSVEPVVPVLRAEALLRGLNLQVQVGDFNAYAQELLNPGSGLYRFDPDIVVLAVQTRDVAPELWSGFGSLSPTEVDAVVERVVSMYRGLAEAFRSRCRAHLVLHSLEMPLFPSSGILDAQTEGSQIEALQRINSEIRRIAREQSGVYVLDYDALVARWGREGWHDERKWLTMRMPIAAEHLVHLAREWMRFIQPLAGKLGKVLVVDLDNTLWGGVIGEDGLAGIKLGAEYPGAAFQELQRVLLDLYHRGIILAVSSKNNPADVEEVFERHPGMLLRREHFASMRVNWNDKAENLRQIATELNVGLDSLVFLDDSPVERQSIRAQLPEVDVLDLPNDSMRYAAAVRDWAAFERLSVSVEDRERGRYYAEQRLRTELKQTVATVEDFLRSLRMQVVIFPLTPATIGRVAQLTQKTNQFNVTTRRYTEQELASLMTDPGWRVYALQASDRFGDNGIVGVAILHFQDSLAEIDTLLMSCRVIGRTVETAFLSTLAEVAESAGATRLVGWFRPTSKNAPAQEFYASHNFTRTEVRDGATRWELDLHSQIITSPAWIARQVIPEE